MNLTGKIAVITGSGQGLGKAFASKLLQEGAKVSLSDVRDDLGLEACAQLQSQYGQENVCFHRCDVTKRSELEGLYTNTETHFGGRVDIFCNNAGISHTQGWRKCLDVNIYGVMEGTELAMERMSLENGGRGGLIVNTASMAGILHSNNSHPWASYFVSKHGVVAITRMLGTSTVLQKSGVRVQCICPFYADTAIVSDVSPNFKRKVADKFGLMTPEYVSDAFMLLIKNGGNGEAVVVSNNCPPFIYPDSSLQLMSALSAGANVCKIFGGKLITVRQQLILFSTLFILLQICLAAILTFTL